MPKKVTTFQIPVFKNKPLVRCSNTIYYGNISDNYIIKMEIVSTGMSFDETVANNVTIQLLSTNPQLSARQKILKQCKRNGLYESMDIAYTWLEKAIEETSKS